MEPGLVLFISGTILVGIILGVLLTRSGWIASKVPMESPVQDIHDLFAPNAGLSRCSVFRRSTLSGGQSIIYTVGVDGRSVGATAPGTYVVLDLTAGRHVVTSTVPGGMDAIDIHLQEGELVFVEHRLRHGLGLPGVKHIRIDDQEGREIVSRLRRARVFA